MSKCCFLISLALLLISTNHKYLSAQNYEPDRLQVRFLDINDAPQKVGTTYSFPNSAVANLFSGISIVEFDPTFPNVMQFDHPNAEPLSRVFNFRCDNCVAADLMDGLIQNGSGYFDRMDFVEIPISTSSVSYFPNDYYNPSWATWRMSFINASEAWDITKGDPDIKIAIVECCNGFDIDHEDLVGNIHSIHGSMNDGTHGTHVAGDAAATTDNGIGISAIGFNSSLMLYGHQNWNGILEAALDGANKKQANKFAYTGL